MDGATSPDSPVVGSGVGSNSPSSGVYTSAESGVFASAESDVPVIPQSVSDVPDSYLSYITDIAQQNARDALARLNKAKDLFPLDELSSGSNNSEINKKLALVRKECHGAKVDEGLELWDEVAPDMRREVHEG
jgi:hypothetical protein